MSSSCSPLLIQAMHKGWYRFSEAPILVDADPDEKEGILVTCDLQGFRVGLTDFPTSPWKPLSSEQSVALASSKRRAS